MKDGRVLYQPLMLTDAEELIKNPKGWFVQMNMTK